MSKFAPGMRVIIRDEEWIINRIETNSLNNQALFCTGISTLVKDKEVIFLSDLESVEIVDPTKVELVPDDSAYYKKTKLYLESLWRQQIPTDEKVHIGHKAAMDTMPYQLVPAQESLKNSRQRILIADAVGLGKTLEAGILMSELIARGKGKRILVVTVKSMMTQFQKEMWNRFTIPLVRLDSSRIQRIRTSLPSNYNPFFYYDKTIISVDTLKRDIEYRTYLENAYWDIIVIDEAQNVAERGDKAAQRSKLAKLLSNRSDTMIMLSATPHDGRAKSFASLMNMLDPTAISNPNEYTQDDIQGLCIRRFKKDIQNQVSGAFLEREVHLERCKASLVEEMAFNIFAEMSLQMDIKKRKDSGRLFKTTLEKSLFSSPAACIKSVENRLKVLKKKYSNNEIEDIKKLELLKTALEKITPESFSRYQQLLKLLRNPEYNWNPKLKDDRLVIFTERIETMKWLSENLKKDLKLNDKQVVSIYGGMSDSDIQEVVEDFGREESPIRVLVASDVASEGLNLHYLSHRMIHFDIPWSLMVFQQRNGRIDRYGQEKRPDIRYMLIESDNKKIKGDTRIIEVLITKEEQAMKNIGDPALLLGKFSIEDAELVVMEAVENETSDVDFASLLDSASADYDPLEALMAGTKEETVSSELPVEDETLFTDLNYLVEAINYLSKEGDLTVSKLDGVSGIEIKMNADMKRRLSALLPEEAMPEKETLWLSDDKQFCMQEMKKSMQSSMESTAWPQTQYLWKLHPLFTWINDKTSLLVGRNQAPVIGIEKNLAKDEIIYVLTSSIPNKRSTSVVDEWFGILYKNNKFERYMTMNEIIQKTKLSQQIPNRNVVTSKNVQNASGQLVEVIEYAKKYMKDQYDAYNKQVNPLIDAEMDKLTSLYDKHKTYQLSLFESERKRDEATRKVDELFKVFFNYVEETMTIQDTPYIRVASVMVGV